MGYDPITPRMYVRLPATWDATAPAGALTEMMAAIRDDAGEPVLEVSTTSTRFFREFHRFAGLIAEDFEPLGSSAVGAFDSALQRWRAFTAARPILTDEQQLGLHGELLLLTSLMRKSKIDALRAWIGRDAVTPSRHDFRIGQADIEVKTTRGTTRHHYIHGLQQLVAANGHTLHILSLRLEDAGSGDGAGLSELVARVREDLQPDTATANEFEQKLSAASYYDADVAHYGRKLTFADKPRLVEIDIGTPRITTNMLEDTLGSELASRIDQVNYRVNLEGMGNEEGSPEYAMILPGVTVEHS